MIDNVLGHPSALMERDNEINVFMPANTTSSILQSMDHGVISTLKSSYVRQTFHKGTAAINSDCADGPGQSELNTFRDGLPILDAIKSI